MGRPYDLWLSGYGYPGDGINGLIGAVDRCDGRIRFIQPRREEAAAFMACGHAKFTGQVGVCMATSGPGAIHLLNGLYDARMDHQPVVAIVGQSARTAMGSDYQQEVDLKTLFKGRRTSLCPPVHASRGGASSDRPRDADRIGRARRDLRDHPARCPGARRGRCASPRARHHAHRDWLHRGVAVPAAADLHAAAAVLNSGKRVAMLVGAGALGASDEVLAVADALGAGIAKALLGKAVVPRPPPVRHRRHRAARHRAERPDDRAL